MLKINTSLRKMIMAFFALSLLSTSSVVFAADTYKIGVGGAHTGEIAPYGIPSLKAVELAADEINANGGILGKPVEIVSADAQCKPELAQNAATSLLSEEVIGVIGMICSGTTKAALPIFTHAEVILISPAATTPDLTLSGDNPYFLRTIGHDFIQGELAAEFIGKHLQAKKVAFLHDNAEYGKSYTETTRKKLEELYPEVEVVIFEAVTAGASDYSAAIRKVRRSGAEALIWGGYHTEASKIVNNMRDLGLDIPLVGSDSLKEDSYIEIAGEASENTYTSAPSDTTALPTAVKVHKAHEEKFNNAMGVFGDNAYAATIALANAINKAGTTETKAVMQALQNEVVDTPIGQISFDEHGDAKGIGMTMFKVEDGEFVPVFDYK